MTHTIRDLLSDAADRASTYLEQIDDRSVAADPDAVAAFQAALSTPLPLDPTAAGEVLAFLDDMGSPATTANAGPRYFGFVTGGALPSTVAANVLAAAWDQNSFGAVSSPGTAALEAATLDWLKEALGLPLAAEGALVTGATMANFTCLASARDEMLRRAGWNVDSHGLFGAPPITVVVGEEVHASVRKVLAMLGLGRDRVVKVPVDTQGRMRADALPDLAGPTIVCVQAGNVNSGAFDPAAEIVPWAHAADAWVHVDGAFGLWAMATDALAHLADGFEAADSWAADAHKWLNVPYDCGVALVRDPAALHRAMSISGAYLVPSGGRDAMDVTPDSSRRARSVEVWAALKSLGRTGLEDLILRNCRHASAMAEGLRAAGVEVLNDVDLNQVVAAFEDDETTARVIGAVQADGVCWAGPTEWHGRVAMRISFSSWATRDVDVESSLASIVGAFRTHNSSDQIREREDP